MTIELKRIGPVEVTHLSIVPLGEDVKQPSHNKVACVECGRHVSREQAVRESDGWRCISNCVE